MDTPDAVPQTKADKVRMLVDELLASEYFFDGLKNRLGLDVPAASTAPKATPIKKYQGQLFLPELDYFIWAGLYNQEFVKCGYARVGDTMNVGTISDEDFVIGYRVEGGNFDSRVTYFIPCGSLKAWLTNVYGVPYQWDYRVKESKTMYTPGLREAGANNQPAKGNMRVRELEWVPREGHDPKLLRTVVANTRAYWEDELAKGNTPSSLVTYDTMMELLDKIEKGILLPGQIPWHVDVLTNDQVNTRPFSQLSPIDRRDAHKISIAKG
jgi:hypothetical protein